jgi:hypothetical protein
VKKVALVVEGLGDRKSFPSLVTKAAQLCGEQVYVTKIIEAGDWPKIRRPGELERFCKLASIANGVDEIVLALDLDDGCAKSEYEASLDRLAAVSCAIGKPVHLCFCTREFETWFLLNLEDLRSASPEIEWSEADPPENVEGIRAAKQAFERQLGSKYRESIDQEKFAKRLNLETLYSASRSFRKFVKSITGLTYEETELLL